MQTFSGLEYLKIDIANNYGLDKKTWDERLDWFNKNEPVLEKLVSEADNPCLFATAVNEYRKVKEGIPSGYPIHLDATASGTQWLAILTGDRKAAKLCNVLNTGAREDSYTLVFNQMRKKGDFPYISRENVKKAIMTSLYGSEAKPKELFGDLVGLFEATMEEAMPEAWQLNKLLAGPAWDPTAIKYQWVLPDNFHAGFKVKDLVKKTITLNGNIFNYYVEEQMPTSNGKALGANLIHSIDGFVVREMVMRCSFDHTRAIKVLNGEQILGTTEDIFMCMTLWNLYLDSGYLSARILNYIFENTINLVDRTKIEELVKELPKKNFDILPIHDSFSVLPNYGNDARQQYIYCMYHMSKSNVLNYLFKQIGIEGRWYKSEDFSEEILESEYALS